MHPKVLSRDAWKTVRRLVAAGLTESWTLAGGTALALQLGHRYSEDLDFSRHDGFDVDRMVAGLASVGTLRIQSRTADTLHAELQRLRISFLKAAAPFVFPGTRYRGLTVSDPRDIAVMKLIAIGGRGSCKDFIDLYFFLEGGGSLSRILASIRDRFTRIDYNEYHLLKSLLYFDDAEAEPMPSMIRPVPWEKVRNAIIKAVRELSET
ncbi:MAG: nucleotidyl transferase AbiEii/AbiGii toxin family protein [Gammaproteobacteria bacterium]|nr:nucleotidyl transferase AbiEii/AbiGii toxin family protein [Gammaproteobacteria bacterium]